MKTINENYETLEGTKALLHYADDIKYLITNADKEEIVNELRQKYPKVPQFEISIDVKDGFLGYNVIFKPVERIRRITGYLTGGTDKWNNAKRDELKERVKHIGGTN